jgi:transcriptional regulator with XRE-family HTH domain
MNDLSLRKPIAMTEKSIHEGRNIKRIREILGIKQDALAVELGLSQQAVSALEQREALDKDMLEKVAKALKISSEAIKNFNEEATYNNIANNFNDNSYLINYQFNPVEKIIELYERIIKDKDEKIALLEKMIDKK